MSIYYAYKCSLFLNIFCLVLLEIKQQTVSSYQLVPCSNSNIEQYYLDLMRDKLCTSIFWISFQFETFHKQNSVKFGSLH